MTNKTISLDLYKANAALQLRLTFLAHCEGAHDALAFMLARRTLLRQGIEPGPEWMRVFAFLQGEKE